MPLTIDHVNTTLSGGAAVAARRVHDSLLAAGAQSRFWFARGETPPNRDDYARLDDGECGWWTKWTRELSRWRFKRRTKRQLRGRPEGLELFNPTQAPHLQGRTARQLDGDVIHLHWIGGCFDDETFFASVPPGKPIVWTLHDMHAMTGGCHYNVGCERFMNGCGKCPQLGRPALDDLSRSGFTAKQRAYADHSIHVTAPSRWLLEEARRSPLLSGSRSFARIPYGIDLERFAPRPQSEARQRLGLPPDAVVVLFGSEDVQNRRKGASQLIEALKRLPRIERLHAVYFGRGEIEPEANLPPMTPLGFLDRQERQVDAYAASDFFVMPSLQDNLPQTGMESLCCGRPVAAFDVGGAPDFVRPEETGLLAPVGDVDGLAAAIFRLATDGELRERLSAGAREFAVRNFDPRQQAERYLGVYADAMKGWRESGIAA